MWAIAPIRNVRNTVALFQFSFSLCTDAGDSYFESTLSCCGNRTRDASCSPCAAAHFLFALKRSAGFSLAAPARPLPAWHDSHPHTPPTGPAHSDHRPHFLKHTRDGPTRGCVRSGLWLSEKRTDVHPKGSIGKNVKR